MIAKTVSPKKNKTKDAAQGMVEFALVIPILLLVVYGLLEVGRLLFIYSSVVTAARQAVRYGAVTGVSDEGYPRYQDCAGIRAAARKVGFINDFPDDGFDITFDAGPGSTAYATCNGVDFLGIDPQNGDRLVVSVSASFSPILSLIPLDPMTIESSSSRTILRDVGIYTDAGTVVWDGSTSTPTNTPTPSATNTPTDTPTPTPTSIYTATPSNTPTITLTPTITNTPTITFTPTNTGTPTYTPTATATPIACFVSHDGVAIAQDKMLLNVNNDSSVEITISEITVFYNSSQPAGQGLEKIYVGNTVVWDGFKTGSPITITSYDFANDYSDDDSDDAQALEIDPGSVAPFKLFFAKNLQENGTEVLSISFVENGCDEHSTNP